MQHVILIVHQAALVAAFVYVVAVVLWRPRRERPPTRATFKQVVLDVAERTQCPAIFGRSEN